VDAFTQSVRFDRRLFAVDVRASIAHAKMLSAVGLISNEDYDAIAAGLAEIEREVAAGTFPLSIEREDIHMNIEAALIHRLGDVGRKLHTARSRNDQVATDMRLWTRDAIDTADTALAGLQRAFLGRCERDAAVILPAYTHLQRAQPVMAPHYYLAYCEKFQRDRDRLADCRRRVNVSPLGMAAVAGTSLPIDREMTAAQLGFEGIAENSLDVSSDRDFLVEFVFCLTLIAEHLSGWAEEWILWSTTEFGFLTLPQAFCTGSSIMPQKVNPDCLELIRGKTARVLGDLTALLTLIKGLPLAYNRDLQEDKPPVFDAFDTVSACLEMAAPMVAEAELQTDVISERLDRGYLDATSLMEHLIAKGTPQRTAHHLVGALVAKAKEKNQRLADLPLSVFQEADAGIDSSVYEWLGVENAVQKLDSRGGGGPDAVAQQGRRWRERLEG